MNTYSVTLEFIIEAKSEEDAIEQAKNDHYPDSAYASLIQENTDD